MIWRALLAVALLPGIFAGVLPWVIAAHDPWRGEGYGLGAAVLGAGIGIVILCVRDFLVVGRGTLAPWDPTRHLVIVGLYRYVRNPMYLGVFTMLLGTALATGSPLVIAYAVIVSIPLVIRTVYYEEPWLAARHGEQWRRYASEVPRWLPK